MHQFIPRRTTALLAAIALLALLANGVLALEPTAPRPFAPVQNGFAPYADNVLDRKSVV